MNTKQLTDKLAGLASQPAILVGLVLLVVLICVATTYQRLSMPTQSQPENAVTASGDLVSTGLSIREIIAMELFGAARDVAQTVVDHQNIPETNLKLVLKGAFSHRDPEQASALIATNKGKRAELYFIDAELPGNATLKEVYPSYVVLSRAGRLEKLLFFRNQGATDPGRNKSHSSQQYSDVPASSAAPEKYVQPQYSEPESTTESGFTPKSLSDIRAQLRNQAEQPVFSNEEVSEPAPSTDDVSQQYSDVLDSTAAHEEYEEYEEYEQPEYSESESTTESGDSAKSLSDIRKQLRKQAEQQ